MSRGEQTSWRVRRLAFTTREERFFRNGILEDFFSEATEELWLRFEIILGVGEASNIPHKCKSECVCVGMRVRVCKFATISMYGTRCTCCIINKQHEDVCVRMDSCGTHEGDKSAIQTQTPLSFFFSPPPPSSATCKVQ